MSAGPGSPEQIRTHVPLRLGGFSILALLVCGATIGLVGGFVQAVTYDVGGLTLPAGAVVVIVTLIAVIRAAVHLYDRRWAGVVVFGGWVVVSVLLAYQWSGGDVVIARAPRDMVYLFGGAVLASGAANLPARLRPPPTPAAAEDPA